MNSRSETYAKTMLSKTSQVHSWRIVRLSMLEEHVAGIDYVESNLAPPLYFKKAVAIQKIPLRNYLCIYSRQLGQAVLFHSIYFYENWQENAP